MGTNEKFQIKINNATFFSYLSPNTTIVPRLRATAIESNGGQLVDNSWLDCIIMRHYEIRNKPSLNVLQAEDLTILRITIKDYLRKSGMHTVYGTSNR